MKGSLQEPKLFNHVPLLGALDIHFTDLPLAINPGLLLSKEGNSACALGHSIDEVALCHLSDLVLGNIQKLLALLLLHLFSNARKESTHALLIHRLGRVNSLEHRDLSLFQITVRPLLVDGPLASVAHNTQSVLRIGVTVRVETEKTVEASGVSTSTVRTSLLTNLMVKVLVERLAILGELSWRGVLHVEWIAGKVANKVLQRSTVGCDTLRAASDSGANVSTGKSKTLNLLQLGNDILELIRLGSASQRSHQLHL
ncbi:hypothetical protein HG530_008700 [Fusarium avenaceum]|nr:hypothetical protein HG530_008700 [Fusarium avenaceum]